MVTDEMAEVFRPTPARFCTTRLVRGMAEQYRADLDNGLLAYASGIADINGDCRHVVGEWRTALGMVGPAFTIVFDNV